MPLAVRRQCTNAFLRLLRGHHLEIGRPVSKRIGRECRLDPHHRPSRRTHRRRQSVDVGHDLFRHRTERMGNARQHECILHIDDDQRGRARVDGVKDVLAPSPRNNPVSDRLRYGHLVHANLRSCAVLCTVDSPRCHSRNVT